MTKPYYPEVEDEEMWDLICSLDSVGACSDTWCDINREDYSAMDAPLTQEVVEISLERAFAQKRGKECKVELVVYFKKCGFEIPQIWIDRSLEILQSLLEDEYYLNQWINPETRKAAIKADMEYLSS